MSDPGLRRIAFLARRYGSLRHGVARAIFATVLMGALVVELVSDGLLRLLPNRQSEELHADA